MAGKLVDQFERFSNRLQILPYEYRVNINELLFALRDNVISTTVGTSNISTFRNIITNLHPLNDSLYSENNNRFGIDIDSLYDNNSFYRIYVTNRTTHKDKVFFIGYYIDKLTGNFTERKDYYKMDFDIGIRRYNSENEQISFETESKSDSWKGPKEIEKVAKDNGLFYHFMKKNEKDQTYIRIVDETV